MELILIIVVILLIAGYSAYLQIPTVKGRRLEKKIHKNLKKCAEKFGGIELHDFMFEDQYSSSQIDNMLITSKAIYVIEAKNYNGHIFGSEQNENWTMTVKHENVKRGRNGRKYTKTLISKHQFYNPIKQNQTHINKIIRKFEPNLPVFNIITFGSRAVLRDITFENGKQTFVINLNKLTSLIKELEKVLEFNLSLEELTELVDSFYLENITDKLARKQHVQKIKEKYNK
ncbi:NERD domain-containing protein [Acholeplasma equirhinis]|uniref:nuclease-related domain-containing protein n=1 Tax=Acholeplasma equirhinis TaxID=555393 RepID=UPI00197A8A91|nr:nuclease-related domain-containing protein [Acholeplasma equirhinis]MBN3490966.1 NERD domain-containing protein [Acholeplasma equirhinis]